MFNKAGCQERIETGGGKRVGSCRGGCVTSRCKLGALAGAAVIVSVLGAKLGAGVGEAAGPSSCAAEVLGVKAGMEERNVTTGHSFFFPPLSMISWLAVPKKAVERLQPENGSTLTFSVGFGRSTSGLSNQSLCDSIITEDTKRLER